MQIENSPSLRKMDKLVSKVLTEMQAPSMIPPDTILKKSRSEGLYVRRSLFNPKHKDQQRMFDAMREFAGALNYDKPRWLTLLGPSGIGKTHLAKEVWRHFMDFSRHEIGLDSIEYRIEGNTGQFCDWRRFCGDLRGGSFGRVDDICSDWFVVLDDIGSAHDPSGFIASTLDRICNSRQRKWTLITCNLSLNQIAAKMDAPIADRMMRNNSVVIEANCPSWAMEE